MTSKLAQVIFLLLLAAIAPATVKADLLGLELDGTLVRINERNASSNVIGESEIRPSFSLARSNAGLFFATSNFDLYTLDPNTGASTLIAPLSYAGGVAFVDGLAFSPSGTLYAIGSVRDVFDNNVLFTLDPASGTLTFIGDTGLRGGLLDLAFSADGRLYSYSIGGSEDDRVGLGLVTLDPLTGEVTDINPGDNSINTFAPFSLTFSPSGTLYGTNIGIPDTLLRFDTASGEVRVVGLTGTNQVGGIAFIGEERPIPEPATMMLLGTGLVGLGAAVRRRQKGRGK